MHSLPDTARRVGSAPVPPVTTQRRQPRPADPDLANLDRRIIALEALGDIHSRRFAVAILRRRWQHLERGKSQQTAQWFTEASNLTLAIEREERYRA